MSGKAYVYFAGNSPKIHLQSAHDIYASEVAKQQFASHGYSIDLLYDLSRWRQLEAPSVFFGHDKPTPEIHAAMCSMGIHMVSLSCMWSRPYSLTLCQDHNLPVVPWIRFTDIEKAKAFHAKYGRVLVKLSYVRKHLPILGVLGDLPLKLMGHDNILMAACHFKEYYKLYVFNGHIVLARECSGCAMYGAEAKLWIPFHLDDDLSDRICRFSSWLTARHGAFLSSVDMMMWKGKLHVIELNPSSVGVASFGDGSAKLRSAMIDYIDLWRQGDQDGKPRY